MQGPAIAQRFIDLAGGPQALIVVIPTAGGGETYDQFYRGLKAFRDQGATNLRVLHTKDRAVADSDEFVQPIREAGGVWFSGGRQWRLADSYLGTRTEDELWKLLDRGGVIGGSSAGATIQGSYLARGDTKTNTIMMIQLHESKPELLGIGLDEIPAIVVQGDGFEVIGASYVVIYDHQKMIGEAGKFYFLAPGDRYDLAKREAVRPSRQMRPVERVEVRPWRQ